LGGGIAQPERLPQEVLSRSTGGISGVAGKITRAAVLEREPSSHLTVCASVSRSDILYSHMADGTGAVLSAVLCLFVALPLMAQTSRHSSGDSAAQKFAQLSDQFMKESLALSPTSASAAGYHKHLDTKTGKTIELDALLDDLSLDSINKQRAFYAQWRERFRKETPVSALNTEDAADWQLID